MPDALLINPAWPGRVSRRGSRHNRAWPPLDLLNCAALLRRQGLSVDLLDLRARPRPWWRVAEAARSAGLVLLTSSPLDRWQCPNLELEHFLALARGLRHPGLFITGAHGTLLPRRVLEGSGAAGVLLGEPEPGLAGLARGLPLERVPGLAYLRDGHLTQGPPRQPQDLAGLPLPAFDLAPPEHYRYEALGGRLALLETSRGCRQACAFCLKTMYGPGLRSKTAAQVEEEARRVAALGARSVYFVDLDFSACPALALEVCQRLQAARLGLAWCCQARADGLSLELLRAMARAGCRLIHLGVESPSQEMLRDLGKNLDLGQVARVAGQARELGVALACFFLFGLPGETDAQRRGAAALGRRLGAAFCSFHRVTLYPGTPWQGRQAGPDVFQEPDPTRPPDQIDRHLRRAYLDFYLHPATLLRVARQVGARGLWEGLGLWGGFLRRGRD
ncbi:MAG: radical SAM protein [Pseudomonadota bacterium]